MAPSPVPPTHDELTGHPLGGVADIPLDYQTAVLNNMHGWWWTSVAVRLGRGPAAMHTLPGEAESAAQHVARRLNSVSPATIAIAQRVADVAFGQAVNAFQASLPLLRATRGRGSISPSVRHITDDVVGSAERLGSSAAKAARTLALLSALQEGAQ